MAIVAFFNGRKNKKGEKLTYKTLGSVRRLINYILQESKTRDELMGGIYCNPKTAFDEFVLTKAIHNKLPEGPVSKSEEVIHFTQSFKIEEITPELAKDIADKLLTHKLFEGFQIVYAVHTDQKHIHTHFAINSVNYETGLRWHISKYDLQKIKDWSNELCRENNLSVLPKMEQQRIPKVKMENRLHEHVSKGEYRAAKEGRSWKTETLYAGMAARKVSRSRDEFIEIMNKFGYQVRWEESRKDITYTNSDGKKINSDKLGYPAKNFTPLTKESLEKQFALNRQVETNHNTSIQIGQERLRNQLFKMADTLAKNSSDPYPFQNSDSLKPYFIDGQALKDKIIESEKGKGLDWEKD